MAESLGPDAGTGLTALGINCTLKKSPETSNTEALMNRVLGILREHGVETEILRPVDYEIKFGVSSDEGDGDEWPQILEKIKAADILLIGMSIWSGSTAPTTSATTPASTPFTTRWPAWWSRATRTAPTRAQRRLSST
jgi:NADPH-dependent FMN reductase